jgi:hypothetical protein
VPDAVRGGVHSGSVWVVHILLILPNFPSSQNHRDGRSIQVGLNVDYTLANRELWKVQVFGIEIDCYEEVIIADPNQQTTVFVCGNEVSWPLRNIRGRVIAVVESATVSSTVEESKVSSLAPPEQNDPL